MKCLFEFIVHVENPFSDTMTTESGNTFFINQKLSQGLSANRIAKVIAVPIHHETEIGVGFEVAIDPTILFEQAYALTHGTQDSSFLVDKAKSYYKIPPSMIVLFRENPDHDWQGYLNNSLFEEVEKKSEAKSSLIFTESLKTQYEVNNAKLVFGNKELLEDATVGDILSVDGTLGVDFLLDGKKYKWFKNEDVLGILI